MKNIEFRRKREGKTDYRKRLKILLSHKLRFVVRLSLKNVIAQIVEYNENGDKILLTASSKELEKKIGWKAGKNNIPACYLVGFLAGKKAIKSKINEVILDIGLLDSVKGGKVYAALKGAIDAGLSISHSKEILPNDATLNGSVISNYAKKLSQENKEKYNRVFAGYIKNGIKPEELTKYFEETKKKIN